MRIKKGFELREICGVNVIISYGVENIDLSTIVSLNESASELWNKYIGKDFTESDMVGTLCELYDVDETTALADVRTMLGKWREASIIE